MSIINKIFGSKNSDYNCDEFFDNDKLFRNNLNLDKKYKMRIYFNECILRIITKKTVVEFKDMFAYGILLEKDLIENYSLADTSLDIFDSFLRYCKYNKIGKYDICIDIIIDYNLEHRDIDYDWINEICALIKGGTDFDPWKYHLTTFEYFKVRRMIRDTIGNGEVMDQNIDESAPGDSSDLGENNDKISLLNQTLGKIMFDKSNVSNPKIYYSVPEAKQIRNYRPRQLEGISMPMSVMDIDNNILEGTVIENNTTKLFSENVTSIRSIFGNEITTVFVDDDAQYQIMPRSIDDKGKINITTSFNINTSNTARGDDWITRERLNESFNIQPFYQRDSTTKSSYGISGFTKKHDLLRELGGQINSEKLTLPTTMTSKMSNDLSWLEQLVSKDNHKLDIGNVLKQSDYNVDMIWCQLLTAQHLLKCSQSYNGTKIIDNAWSNRISNNITSRELNVKDDSNTYMKEILASDIRGETIFLVDKTTDIEINSIIAIIWLNNFMNLPIDLVYNNGLTHQLCLTNIVCSQHNKKFVIFSHDRQKVDTLISQFKPDQFFTSKESITSAMITLINYFPDINDRDIGNRLMETLYINNRFKNITEEIETGLNNESSIINSVPEVILPRININFGSRINNIDSKNIIGTGLFGDLTFEINLYKKLQVINTLIFTQFSALVEGKDYGVTDMIRVFKRMIERITNEIIKSNSFLNLINNYIYDKAMYIDNIIFKKSIINIINNNYNINSSNGDINYSNEVPLIIMRLLKYDSKDNYNNYINGTQRFNFIVDADKTYTTDFQEKIVISKILRHFDRSSIKDLDMTTYLTMEIERQKYDITNLITNKKRKDLTNILMNKYTNMVLIDINIEGSEYNREALVIPRHIVVDVKQQKLKNTIIRLERENYSYEMLSSFAIKDSELRKSIEENIDVFYVTNSKVTFNNRSEMFDKFYNMYVDATRLNISKTMVLALLLIYEIDFDNLFDGSESENEHSAEGDKMQELEANRLIWMKQEAEMREKKLEVDKQIAEQKRQEEEIKKSKLLKKPEAIKKVDEKIERILGGGKIESDYLTGDLSSTMVNKKFFIGATKSNKARWLYNPTDINEKGEIQYRLSPKIDVFKNYRLKLERIRELVDRQIYKNREEAMEAARIDVLRQSAQNTQEQLNKVLKKGFKVEPKKQAIFIDTTKMNRLDKITYYNKLLKEQIPNSTEWWSTVAILSGLQDNEKQVKVEKDSAQQKERVMTGLLNFITKYKTFKYGMGNREWESVSKIISDNCVIFMEKREEVGNTTVIDKIIVLTPYWCVMDGKILDENNTNKREKYSILRYINDELRLIQFGKTKRTIEQMYKFKNKMIYDDKILMSFVKNWLLSDTIPQLDGYVVVDFDQIDSQQYD